MEISMFALWLGEQVSIGVGIEGCMYISNPSASTSSSISCICTVYSNFPTYIRVEAACTCLGTCCDWTYLGRLSMLASQVRQDGEVSGGFLNTDDLNEAGEKR
jgi:hypothetical protein